MVEQRINEAVKLGFSTCILPKVSLKGLKNTDGIRLIGIESVREALELL